MRDALFRGRVGDVACLASYLSMQDRQEAFQMYAVNTLWAIAKSMGGRKYRVKPLSELMPPITPERHDSRTGEDVKNDVIRTLEAMARKEARQR